VSSILYRLDGRGPNEAQMIRTSVLDRFGDPSSLQPMSWCEHPGPTGACPTDQPRLVFELEPGTGCLLFLTADVAAPPPR
jgi:hypothetical protein